jgi:hypothetical protein
LLTQELCHLFLILEAQTVHLLPCLRYLASLCYKPSQGKLTVCLVIVAALTSCR